MNRYGQAITWGTLSAPRMFTGQTRSFSVRDALTKKLFTDMVGDNIAAALTGSKAEINFEAMVTEGSTDFLDLSEGAAVALSGFSTGVVLASRAFETWRIGEAKTAGVTATWFPDIVQASPTAPGVLSAFTPEQSGLDNIVMPGGKLIYSTVGMTHSTGVMHGLTIEQLLQITPDDESPEGKILGAATHGYQRTISLDLLATGSAPAKGSVLSLTGAPSHASNYRITDVNKTYEDQRGMMFNISAFWISGFAS